MMAPGLLASSDLSASYGLEWIGLALVAVFFWRYVRPPLRRAMDAQAERIRASLSSAEEAQLEGAKLVERAQDALARAREEADALVEQSRHGAERLLEEGRRRAEEEYARVVARAHTEIALERARLEDEIASELSERVVRATSRIVEAELDVETQRRLFDEVIDAAEAEAS
jgi:F-type H+-transporting ATPase subunit b